jgi:Cys-tRNA(Pro) deacylase
MAVASPSPFVVELTLCKEVQKLGARTFITEFVETMNKERTSVTAAMRVLKEHHVSFGEHPYKYQERGGTAVSAKELCVDEYTVVKTLVMEDEAQRPLIVLMHGNREVSTKELARQIGAKKVSPCTPETAHRHTGYMVGGTSPFGTRKKLPVYVEETILHLPKIFINGGRRGFLVSIDPKELLPILKPTVVHVAIT